MARINSSTSKPSAPASLSTPLGAGPTALGEIKGSRDQVQKRAYELFLSRKAKNQPGTPEGDWLAAERELAST
jgi:hypothetical protein